MILAIAVLGLSTAEGAKPRTSRSVRQLQQSTARQIRETDAQIKENNRLVAAQLSQLGRLDGEIAQCNGAIALLTVRIDSIKGATAVIDDSIAALDSRLRAMRRSFANALRSSRQARTAMSPTAFIFSSESFSQAFRRVRALRQFAKWRGRKADEIGAVKSALDVQRQRLDALRSQSREAVSQLAHRRADLQGKQDDARALVADLRGKDKQLKRVLRQQREEAARLDAELDRLIAQEQKAAEERRRREEAEARRREQQRLEQQRLAQEEAARRENASKEMDKPASTSTTPTSPAAGDLAANNVKPAATAGAAKPQQRIELGADFGDNKGRLPYPVDGRHVIVKPFGRRQHPDLPKVVTDNSGIDIETAQGATVKSVFEGQVSAIFCPDGYNNVVVVRHGKYATVYANLATLNVRTGDRVKTGQSLGTVFVDSNDNNRSVLHFEIRYAAGVDDVRKENPSLWLR